MSLLLYGNHIFTESFLPVCNKRGAICKKCECFPDVRTTVRLHFPPKCLFHAFHLRHEPYAIEGMRFPAERTSLFSMHPESFPSFPERPPCRHLCLPRRVNFFWEYRLFVFSGVGGIYDSRPPRLSEFLPLRIFGRCQSAIGRYTEQDHARCSSTKLSRARALPVPCLGFCWRGERTRRSIEECCRRPTGEHSFAAARDGWG